MSKDSIETQIWLYK